MRVYHFSLTWTASYRIVYSFEKKTLAKAFCLGQPLGPKDISPGQQLFQRQCKATRDIWGIYMSAYVYASLSLSLTWAASYRIVYGFEKKAFGQRQPSQDNY